VVHIDSRNIHHNHRDILVLIVDNDDNEVVSGVDGSPNVLTRTGSFSFLFVMFNHCDTFYLLTRTSHVHDNNDDMTRFINFTTYLCNICA